jgi:polyhydroxyalkanoate synthesis regulator phasin
MAQNPITSAIGSTKDAAESVQDSIQSLLQQINRTTEDQTAQVQAAIQDLRDRSRENTERAAALVEKQVQAQLNALGLATKKDIERLERKIEKLQAGARAPATKKAATKKAATKKAATKQAATKKAAGEKVGR